MYIASKPRILDLQIKKKNTYHSYFYTPLTEMMLVGPKNNLEAEIVKSEVGEEIRRKIGANGRNEPVSKLNF